jgi:molybdopterin-guanine dinucleotide biosynthesis protein A
MPKALVRVDGAPLWRRQVGVLQGLEPTELMISAGLDWDPGPGPWTVLRDRTPGLGPLEGIGAALAGMSTKLLLVLAVDMPSMPAVFLGGLVEAAGPTGVVPVSKGIYQGLAAIYPHSAFAVAEEVLGGADHSIQHFAKRALAMGLVVEKRVEDSERVFFMNVNRPEDLTAETWPVTSST